jgi:hypothetical protein
MNCDLFQRPIEEIQKDCHGLLTQVFQRGWTNSMIARVFLAHCEPGRTVCTRDMLERISRGEFDYLFFDSTGQSLN